MKKNEKNAWSKVTVSSNWQPRQHVPVKWIPPWKETEIIFWHRYRIMVDNDHAGNSDIHELGPKGTEKQFQL